MSLWVVLPARGSLPRGCAALATIETIEADGLLAIVLQHEIDHLDGKLFIDRISRIKRELYRRKLQKALKEGKTDGERHSSPKL